MSDNSISNEKHILFIVNPISGANNKEDIPALIAKHIDHSKYTFSCVSTERRGHATELAQQAVNSNIDIVVACGGDGTVNEVAKALVHSDTIMGIIPNGSGNGFAMHIGLGRNITKAIKILNTAEAHKIDTCTVNDSFFLNLAGIGFDALVAYKIDKGKKRGLQMYVNTISKELFKFKAENYRVQTDDQIIEGAYSIIAVANAAMYGYNFTIAPKAKLTDGLLDLVLVKEAPLARTVINSWRMLNKSLDKSKLVDIIRTKSVTIQTEKPYYYHVDGESFQFDTDLHFKIVPLSLYMLFPENSPLV